ncbi:MAG: hypothetical protein R3F11_05405 [Verrucomicrobiales bacterium]
MWPERDTEGIDPDDPTSVEEAEAGCRQGLEKALAHYHVPNLEGAGLIELIQLTGAAEFAARCGSDLYWPFVRSMEERGFREALATSAALLERQLRGSDDPFSQWRLGSTLDRSRLGLGYSIHFLWLSHRLWQMNDQAAFDAIRLGAGAFGVSAHSSWAPAEVGRIRRRLQLFSRHYGAAPADELDLVDGANRSRPTGVQMGECDYDSAQVATREAIASLKQGFMPHWSTNASAPSGPAATDLINEQWEQAHAPISWSMRPDSCPQMPEEAVTTKAANDPMDELMSEARKAREAAEKLDELTREDVEWVEQGGVIAPQMRSLQSAASRMAPPLHAPGRSSELLRRWIAPAVAGATAAAIVLALVVRHQEWMAEQATKAALAGAAMHDTTLYEKGVIASSSEAEEPAISISGTPASDGIRGAASGRVYRASLPKPLESREIGAGFLEADGAKQE